MTSPETATHPSPDNTIFDDRTVTFTFDASEIGLDDNGERMPLSDDERKIIKDIIDNDPVMAAQLLEIAQQIQLGATRERLMGRMLPELKDDPSYEVALPGAIEHYFLSIGAVNTKVRRETLQDYHNCLDEPTTEVDKLRAIVAIPVAGHQEYDNIYLTLEQYAKQDLPCDEFEIVLNVNTHVDKVEDYLGHPHFEALSQTVSEIKRFKIDHPEVNLRWFEADFAGAAPAIGKLRSDLYEVIAYDMFIREREADILVTGGDSDTVHLNKEYLHYMVEAFEQSNADYVATRLHWQSAPGLLYDAMVNKLMRYQAYMENVANGYDSRYVTYDASTGFSLATALAVGGYNRGTALGETIGLAARIRKARQSREVPHGPVKEVDVLARGARMRTNSRRLIAAMAMGRSPYHAWHDDVTQFGPTESFRTDTVDSETAEANAKLHWREWIDDFDAHYLVHAGPTDADRLRRAGAKIIGLELGDEPYDVIAMLDKIRSKYQ